MKQFKYNQEQELPGDIKKLRKKFYVVYKALRRPSTKDRAEKLGLEAASCMCEEGNITRAISHRGRVIARDFESPELGKFGLSDAHVLNVLFSKCEAIND